MTTPTATKSTTTTTTTRTCIKNLPPSFDETKLKSHLQSSRPTLQITDCKVLKTKDGRSRKIAFVGFQTSDQAETAVSYFDRTFAGTARLSVSLAFSKKRGPPPSSSGDAEYRPWSKHSVGSSRYAKLHGQQDISDKEEEEDDELSNNVEAKESEEKDRKRDEFLSAMGLSSSTKKKGNVSKSKFWANDDANVEPGAAEKTSTKQNDGANGEGSSSSGESDDDSDSSTSSSDSDGEDEPDAEKKEDKKSTSDLDFLRSKQVKADNLTESDVSDDSSSDSDDSESSSSSSIDSSSEDEEHADGSKGGEKNLQSSAVQESPINAKEDTDAFIKQPPSTPLNDRLFVRNLPFTTTEEDLFELFSQFGNVTSVHIPVDDSKRNKGYAFITFQLKESAKLAMDTMDGEDFQGRLIHILPARPSVEQSNDVDENDLTYKERQALARQKEAEKSSQGWSASFLRGDAVVDNISDRLGVSKGDVLNVKDGISSGNAAVRLALGETHIISENISFFEENGVDVTALESKSNKKGSGSGGAATKRSKTMILVKNLPYDTSMEDLTKTFHAIGGDVPKRILLPPSKTAALVEYGHLSDARRAFRRLAYKKFKHVPLYLEWAPMKAETEEPPAGDNATKVDKKQNSSDVSTTKQHLVTEDPSTETADATGVSQTIYVKNLNFTTTEDQLEKVFTKSGFHPRAVKIPTKAAPTKKHKPSSATDANNNNEMRQLSMGFGFVEFPSESDALKAMKLLQGKLVDGHALEIKLSTKSLTSSKAPPPTDKSSKNTKIMVRNVPFEATRTELLQLFGSFGQLKRVRLPKKFDGTHRGFAFCEFVTSKEAQNAMTTLSRTHLYGRKLVLEWAAAEDEDGKVDVNVVREKAKRDVLRAGLGGGTGISGKKRGKHMRFD